MSSAEGIDVSSFQVDLTVHDLSGLSFAFTKATDGQSATDPHFAANWATIKAARLHRGTYHELQADLPVSQAAHFLTVVRGGGLEPGDMLAVVASDYPGVTDDDVLAFCDAIRSATGHLNPVLAYTDLSVGASLTRTSAAGYPLWVAWPPSAPGLAPPVPLANWETWKLWQWGTRAVPGLGNVDADAWNGSPAEMDAWIASYQPKPPQPKPLTMEPDMIQLDPIQQPHSLVFSNSAKRVRFFCHSAATLRVDWLGKAPTSKLTLGYDKGPQGVAIPDGAEAAVVHIDTGANLVGYTEV